MNRGPGSDRIDNIRDLIPELEGVVEITIPSPVSQHIVSKSITKNTHMGVSVIGLVENMSTYVCPHCDKEGQLFSGEDVGSLADRKNIPYIGKIPFDPRVSQKTDGLFYTECASVTRDLIIFFVGLLRRCRVRLVCRPVCSPG